MQDINYYIRSFETKRKIMEKRMEDVDIAALFESYISEKPIVFQAETTNHCNMKCVMCPRTDKMTRALGHMPMDVFKKVIDQIEPFTAIERLKWQRFINLKLFPSGILNGEDEDFFHYVVSAGALTLHGYGEPPMDLRLIERIRLATEKNIPTYFSCNPVNIKDKFFEEVLEAGVDFIKYSFDGLDAETLYHYRGKKMVVDQIYDRFDKSIEAITKGGYDTVLVLTMLEFGANKEEQRAFLERWQHQNVYVYIKNSHHRWLYEEDNTPVNTSPHTHCFCEYPFNSTSIQYDGTVTPCPLDYDGEMAFGNVMDQSLEEIWQSDNYKNFRRMHAEGTLPETHFCRAKCDFPILGDLVKKQRSATGT